MQHEEIIGLMRGTIPYTKEILSQLSDLIKEYPYFQTAHLLHTLNLLYLKDAYVLIDLRKTAIYVPDRKQLYFLIENNSFDLKLTETLEKETLPVDSSFELIDTFLSESVEETGSENIEIELSPVYTDYISRFLSDKPDKKEALPLQHQAIIDKFLENDAISPLKIKLNKEDKSEEELPEELPSLPIGDGFFTETLAKIYIKQRKYTHALEIIRKLNLIYPEKSRYFADQIRYLEKMIIYTNKIK